MSSNENNNAKNQEADENNPCCPQYWLNFVKQLSKCFEAEVWINLDNGFNRVHFHETSEEKKEDLTGTAYKEVVVRFYRSPGGK